MKYTLYTPIQTMVARGDVGTRLSRACRELGVETLGMLLQLPKGYLKKVEMVGRITEHRLEELQLKYAYLLDNKENDHPAKPSASYSKEDEYVQLELFDFDDYGDDEKMTLPVSTEDKICKMLAEEDARNARTGLLPDPEEIIAFYGEDYANIRSLLRFPEKLYSGFAGPDRRLNMKMMSHLVRNLSTVAERVSPDTFQYDIIRDNLSHYCSSGKLYEMLVRVKAMPANFRQAIVDEFLILINRKESEQERLDAEGVVRFIYTPNSLRHQKSQRLAIPKIYIHNLLKQKVISEITDIIYILSNARTDELPEEFAVRFYEREFPFLSPAEMRHAVRLQKSSGFVPVFYLFERYLSHSDSKQARAIRSFNGITPEPFPLTLQETAAECGVSERQTWNYLNNALEVPATLAEAIAGEQLIANFTILSEESELLAEIARRDGLRELSTRELMSLLTAMTGQHKIIEIYGRKFLVAKSLLKDIKLGALLRRLMNLASKGKNVEELLDSGELERKYNISLNAIDFELAAQEIVSLL